MPCFHKSGNGWPPAYLPSFFHKGPYWFRSKEKWFPIEIENQQTNQVFLIIYVSIPILYVYGSAYMLGRCLTAVLRGL
ncbi:hypothetical protein MKW98_032758 [Papaver atlanticum]|uniref:Uncharacterized protein n=1 Tax=Papaver atlanticum TaxID=357466 RepID=A0AAD4RZ84_9MAGN|nr:hypothetical protein MKW98_032758 [Papaver atlanticum]